jgi:hypothetical protein
MKSVGAICTSSDLWRRNSSSTDTLLTISSHVDITSYSKIRFLRTCLTLLPHTAEADTNLHQWFVLCTISVSGHHIFRVFRHYRDAPSAILGWFSYASRNLPRSSESQMHENKTEYSYKNGMYNDIENEGEKNFIKYFNRRIFVGSVKFGETKLFFLFWPYTVIMHRFILHEDV